MILRSLWIGAAVLAVTSVPAVADPGDYWKKQWEKRADCDKKLYEAKSRRDFYKLDREQRREVAKEWREAEKKWRERNRYDDDDDYYDWDD